MRRWTCITTNISNSEGWNVCLVKGNLETLTDWDLTDRFCPPKSFFSSSPFVNAWSESLFPQSSVKIGLGSKSSRFLIKVLKSKYLDGSCFPSLVFVNWLAFRENTFEQQWEETFQWTAQSPTQQCERHDLKHFG